MLSVTEPTKWNSGIARFMHAGAEINLDTYHRQYNGAQRTCAMIHGNFYFPPLSAPISAYKVRGELLDIDANAVTPERIAEAAVDPNVSGLMISAQSWPEAYATAQRAIELLGNTSKRVLIMV